MANCEHEDSLLARHVAVERDVTSLSEPNHKLSQLRLVVQWPSHVRRGLEQLQVPLDHRSGADRCPSVFLHEEPTAPL